MRGDPLYAAWLLFVTTGMRRGEVAGLRWPDVDLKVGRVSPRRPRVVVNYEVVVSEPKTQKGRRSLVLDPATVAALREHRTGSLSSGWRLAHAGRSRAWYLAGWPPHPPGALLPMVRAACPCGQPAQDPAARRPPQLCDRRAGRWRPSQGGQRAPGHANIAITMDTYSHVLPGLDKQAGTVARLILGDGDHEPARPVDKALTTDRPTPRRREETARSTWSEGCASGGIRTPTGCPTGS